MKTTIYNQLVKIINEENIAIDEHIKNHTYTKLGGKADFFVTPTNYEEVQNVVKFCLTEKVPFTLIGNGSNLIVRDGGIRGIVLSLKNFNKITVSGTRITAQSGAAIIDTSRKALDAKLTGLEFACGIPGTVGGAIYMNAGAYGGEIKDCLESVLVIDKNGEMITRKAQDLDLSYRYSNISRKRRYCSRSNIPITTRKLR